MILLCVLGLATAFTPDTAPRDLLIVLDCLKDIVDYTLGINYFKMITNFVTEFELTTKVNKD